MLNGLLCETQTLKNVLCSCCYFLLRHYFYCVYVDSQSLHASSAMSTCCPSDWPYGCCVSKKIKEMNYYNYFYCLLCSFLLCVDRCSIGRYAEMLGYIMLGYITLWYIMLWYIMLWYIMLGYIMLWYIMSGYIIPPALSPLMIFLHLVAFYNPGSRTDVNPLYKTDNHACRLSYCYSRISPADFAA